MTLEQAYNVQYNNHVFDNGTVRTPTESEYQKATRILHHAGHRTENDIINKGIGYLVNTSRR